MKASISMITRSISVALLVSTVPSVHAATSWMEARGMQWEVPAWRQHTTVPQRWLTRHY